MQIIESELFTILIPDKGYKIINKQTGKDFKKVYLGKLDSVDNYGEIVDEKYVNMDYVVELSNLKEEYNTTTEQNELNTDLVLSVIDEMYTMFEPILAMIPAPMSLREDKKESTFINFYVCMVKRGLKTIDEIPERFVESVKNRIGE